MANVTDYIKWRGDLLFTQDPPNVVDALVFSILSYIRLDGALEPESNTPVKLRTVSDRIFLQDDWEKRGRTKADLELLALAADSSRFGYTEVFQYSEQFIPEEDTQFAAVTFCMDDGGLLLAFRGTDNTLVGWKEDFNMCYQDTVPAQRLALSYANRIMSAFDSSIYLCGHSKGGNLAVFAASGMLPQDQKRIKTVFNFDGPGFSDHMMENAGYAAIVPKIQTFIPQSSVIGLLMEHKEPCTIVKSKSIGILQHDTFNWELIGKELIRAETLTLDSRFVSLTLANWLDGMNAEERNRMVEALFSLLEASGADSLDDVFQPRNIYSYIKTINTNEITRRALINDLVGLYEAAKSARQQLETHKASALVLEAENVEFE